jgi:hypothetical protein
VAAAAVVNLDADAIGELGDDEADGGLAVADGVGDQLADREFEVGAVAVETTAIEQGVEEPPCSGDGVGDSVEGLLGRLVRVVDLRVVAGGTWSIGGHGFR